MSSSVLRNVIQSSSGGDFRSVEPELLPGGRAGDFSDDDTEDMELVLGVLIENAPVAMAMFDRSMRYMLANRQWIGEFGLAHVMPLVGKSQYEIFPSLHPGWRQVYDRALQGHVVRSEHDALSGPDGRQVVYRWEVRPWRRKRDATVGGLMVTCERFTAPLTLSDSEGEGVSTVAQPAPVKELVADPAFETSLPTVIINGHGVIERANQAAVGMSLARGLSEGASVFWDVFSPGKDTSELKKTVREAVEKLNADILPASSQVIQTGSPRIRAGDGESVHPPKRWVLSKLTNPDQSGILAIGLPDLPEPESVKVQFPPATATPAPAPPPAVPSREQEAAVAEVRRLKEELARAHQEARSLREAESGFSQRHHLQSQILDGLPCGILVLDTQGRTVYQNHNLAQILGRPIDKLETVEDWLGEACPSEGHRQQVTQVWREDVWRRQLTRTVSLATADGLLKEVELQPISLNSGQLLVNLLDVTETSRHEEQLLAMEAKFRALLQENPVPVILVDKSGAVFEVNHAAEELLGRPKSEIRRHTLDTWLSADSAKARRDALAELLANRVRSTSLRVSVLPKDRSPVDIDLGVTLVRDASDAPHCTVHFLYPVGSDIPVRPFARPEMAPATQAPAPTPSAQGSPISISWLTTNLNGRISTWSEHAAEQLGIEPRHAVGRPLHAFFKPSDATGFYAALTRAADADSPVDWPILTPTGDRRPMRWVVKAGGRGGYDVELVEMGAAVSVPPAAAPAMAAPPPLMLPERTWPVADLEREKLILSETHHRIKNHLQILSSLLNLQSNSVSDQDARMALRSSQNRVRAIAALHQQLYEASLGRGENFSDFAHGLVQRLRDCYGTPAEQVSVRLEIQEGPIEQEWLVPLALTLSETISNCFEHAFPEGREGSVVAALRFDAEGGHLHVTDDGIGLDADFSAGETAGLGLKILAVFASQLRGHFSIRPNQTQGTSVDLRFPIASTDI